jgi:hypothetical protein
LFYDVDKINIFLLTVWHNNYRNDMNLTRKRFFRVRTSVNHSILTAKISRMIGQSSKRFGPFCRIVASMSFAISVLCVAFNLRASALTLPLSEDFQNGKIGPEWQTNVSSGATFGVNAGSINFDAPAHARAFLVRQANIDLITYSGKVDHWGAIYLVWDAKNWCAVGQLSPTPFGQLYTTVVTNGKGSETDHRGIDFNFPRWVRVQLGGNYIRFYFSTDEKNWSVLRTIERPAGFKGAPKLIAAGKYSTPEDQPFAEEKSDQPEDGRISGGIIALRVEATPPALATLTDSELADLRKPQVEPVNALLQTTDTDPSFDEIVGYYPPMKYPREIVGVPTHPLAIGVDWLGRLDVSPWTAPTAWFEIGNPPMPLATNSSQLKRRLLLGYLPVDTLTTERDGIRYELTAFGWSDGFDVARPLFAYARVTAHALNGTALPKEIALVTPDNKRQTWTMSSINERDAQFCLRFEFPKPASAVEVSAEEFDSKLDTVAKHWERTLAPGNRFDVPDKRVMEAYRALLTYSMLDTKTVNGYPEPHDGSGFYDMMYGTSVSLYASALDDYGFSKLAANILDTELHFQQTNGLFVYECGLTDPGSLLMALAYHYQMTGDREWLRRVRPNIDSQCEWLIQQRKETPHEGPLRGLIKFRPYNDYPTPEYSYLGNAWCPVGMEQAAQALKDINAPEADRFAQEAKSYRKDVLDSMSKTAFKDEGQTLLPMEPETHRLLKMMHNRGGSYYGLTAGQLLECGFLPPDDERTTWVIDMLEKRGGLIAGVCEFEGGVDAAYTYGYLMVEMQRQEIRKTLLGFWSMLAFGMTRDTYSPVEVQMIETGENHLTIPHLYPCTHQLQLLRNMLLREDGEVLWLGQGIPTDWLEPGKHVAVNNAPSEFGDLSYRIDVLKDGHIHISFTPPSRHYPKEVRLCLRQPKGRPIDSIKVIPSVPVEFSGQTAIFEDLKVPVDIEVTLSNETR